MYLRIARGSPELGECLWLVRRITGGLGTCAGCHRSGTRPPTSVRTSPVVPHLRPSGVKVHDGGWLIDEQRRIATEAWVAPRLRAVLTETAPTTVGEYATSWIARRDLKPRTRARYQSLLDRQILPTFAHTVLAQVLPR